MEEHRPAPREAVAAKVGIAEGTDTATSSAKNDLRHLGSTRFTSPGG